MVSAVRSPLPSTMLLLLLLCGGPVHRLLGGNGSPARTVAVAAPSVETTVPVSNKCWIFTHLQKCGGSTVKEILEKNWGQRYSIYDSTRWKLGDNFSGTFAKKLADGESWNVMTGGYPEALRRSSAIADAECQWFTVFRHPIARMVSAFFYCRELPMDVACASEVLDAREADLATFAKHWGNFALRQFALALVPADDVMAYSQTNEGREKLPPDIEDTGKVSGWYLLKMYLDSQARGQEFADIPEVAMYEMVKPVQDLLRDGYAAVGILEEFNTTLSLFDAALDMPGVDWHADFGEGGMVNVDRVYQEEKRKALEEAWTNSEIKKYMRLDLLLYEHAVDVFHEQARRYGLV